MSTFYPSPEDVRQRVYVYLAPDEIEQLERLAKKRRRPKSAVIRWCIALADAEMERYEMHQAITDLARAELQE